MQLPAWISNVLDGAWPLWIIVATLAVIGLPLLLWALFSDRSRGRRRCPRCWYDLRGTPGLRCSECGYEAKRERALFRNRRRWRRAAVGAIAILSSASLSITPKVRREGWASLIPTAVIMHIATTRAAAEAAGRRGPARDWVHRELVRRDVAYDMSATDWLRFLSKANAVRTRNVWPATIPLAVSIVLPEWANCELGAHRKQSSEIVQFGDWAPPWFQRSRGSSADRWVREIGLVTADGSPVSLRCEMCSYSTATMPSGRPIRNNQVEFDLEIPIKIVPRLHDAIPPHTGVEIDTLMRAALRPTIFCGARRKDGIDQFTLAFCRSRDPRLNSLAFGFFVEIRLGEQLIHAFSVVAPNPPDAGDDEQTTVPLNMYPWHDYKPRLRIEPATIRISGDAILGLRDWDRTHYWAGTIEYNLHDLFRDE